MHDIQEQLPQDLIDCGFRLVIFAPGRMCAVSVSRGGTGTRATIAELVTEARRMASWCAWMDDNRPIRPNTSDEDKHDAKVQPAP